MTERIYKCYVEVYVDGVPQGMVGEQMNLLEWLEKTERLASTFEHASDEDIIDYMRDVKGKYLREV